MLLCDYFSFLFIISPVRKKVYTKNRSFLKYAFFLCILNKNLRTAKPPDISPPLTRVQTGDCTQGSPKKTAGRGGQQRPPRPTIFSFCHDLASSLRVKRAPGLDARVFSSRAVAAFFRLGSELTYTHRSFDDLRAPLFGSHQDRHP